MAFVQEFAIPANMIYWTLTSFLCQVSGAKKECVDFGAKTIDEEQNQNSLKIGFRFCSSSNDAWHKGTQKKAGQEITLK